MTGRHRGGTHAIRKRALCDRYVRQDLLCNYSAITYYGMHVILSGPDIVRQISLCRRKTFPTGLPGKGGIPPGMTLCMCLY